MLILLKRSQTPLVLALSCALWIAAFAAASGACSAQDTSDEASGVYPVKGTVVNSMTHQPVARALVDAHESAVLSDNDGHFEFDLPEGTYLISVKRPGYGSRGRPTNHTIRVGPNMPSLTFSLTPEAVITGQVTLSTSDPADGIRVMAYRRRVINGRQQWMMENTARTNSDGAFRIPGLEAGDYLVYTQPARDGEGPQARGVPVYGFPPSYYPGVADIASAGVLTLASGQQGRADFILTRQQFYNVTVTVADRNGSGVNLQVYDRSGRQVGLGVRWNGEQGTGETNLPSGSYFIEGRRRGESQLYGRVDFTVAGAPVNGLTLALSPLHPIAVTVRKTLTSTNNGNQGALVSADGGVDSQASAGLNISLTPVDEVFGQFGNGGRLQPAEGANDGSAFEIENVSPGRYWVETTPFEGYVSSISSGGVDLARDPLVVGAGGSTAPIEVTLRDDAGTISGQLVTDPAASAPATTGVGEQQQIFVYAIPLFASSGPIRMGVIPGSGQVSLAGLAPGSYRVIAFDAPQEIDFHTPDGLAKYSGMGATTTVDAGATANVQLEVVHTGATTEAE